MADTTNELSANLTSLRCEISRVRRLTQSFSLDGAQAWTKGDLVQMDAEIRWCIEALRDFGLRVAAAASR